MVYLHMIYKLPAPLILFGCFWLLNSAALADTITLTSGQTVSGQIIEETKQSYTLKSGIEVILTYYKEDVASVSREQSPALASNQAPLEAPAVVVRRPEIKLPVSSIDKQVCLSSLDILKDLDKALKYCTEANDKTPNDAQILTALGQTYNQLNDFTQAAEFFNKALAIDTNNAIAHQMLGRYAVKDGAIDAALEHLEKGKELKPADTAVTMDLAFGYWVAKDYKSALELFEEVVAQDKLNDQAYLMMGECLKSLKRPTEALAALQSAAAINPDPNLLMRISQLSLKMKNPDEAIVYLRKAIRLKPNDPYAHEKLGTILGLMNRGQESEKAYKESARLFLRMGQLKRARNIERLGNLSLQLNLPPAVK